MELLLGMTSIRSFPDSKRSRGDSEARSLPGVTCQRLFVAQSVSFSGLTKDDDGDALLFHNSAGATLVEVVSAIPALNR